MHLKFEAENQDDIQFRLEVSMSLGEWKQLRAQLKDGWPSWKVSEQISNMIRQAEHRYYPPVPGDND